MTIKEIKIESLKEYENNPRNNEGAVGAVAESIKNFGFKVPIIIDRNNVIVAGHTRLKAAKSLGLETVPCIVADDLTEEQIKAFRLADNKTAELAEWDFDKLETELAELAEMGVEMDGFGFDELQEPDFEELERDASETDEQITIKIVFQNVTEWQKHEAELRNLVNKFNASIVVGNG